MGQYSVQGIEEGSTSGTCASLSNRKDQETNRREEVYSRWTLSSGNWTLVSSGQQLFLVPGGRQPRGVGRLNAQGYPIFDDRRGHRLRLLGYTWGREINPQDGRFFNWSDSPDADGERIWALHYAGWFPTFGNLGGSSMESSRYSEIRSS